jgi:hypothetical protein
MHAAAFKWLNPCIFLRINSGYLCLSLVFLLFWKLIILSRILGGDAADQLRAGLAVCCEGSSQLFSERFCFFWGEE